jgi:hypothetical protein
MRIAAAFLLLALATVTTRAQGTVAFHNTASPGYRFWTNNWQGNVSNLISGADAYRIGLYGSTDLAASEGSLVLLALATNAPSAALAGYFNGGSALPLAGLSVGTAIRFHLRAWSLSAGANWSEASITAAQDPYSLGMGTSPLGSTVLGGGIIPPGALFGTSPGQLSRGFMILHPELVPEPSLGALAFLGAVTGFLFLRRRAH